jgi:hypothetical protein
MRSIRLWGLRIRFHAVVEARRAGRSEFPSTARWRLQRVKTSKVPRQPWHFWHPWHLGICKLLNQNDARETESLSLRHPSLTTRAKDAHHSASYSS